MSNEIVKVHNNLIDLPLRRFNSSEIDIFTALCYKCNEKDTHEVILPFSEIRELAHYKNKNEEQFISAIKTMNEKLMSLHFTIGNERNFTQFVLFPTFTVSSDAETLTVKVHEDFAYLLNNLSNYTSIELQESTALKSSYSKGIYKKLRQFRNTDKPFWKVKLDDFREHLDIPSSYTLSDINKRVLKPAIEELSPYFQGLNLEPYFDKKKGQRGRPKVAGYIFTFKAEPKKDHVKKDNVTGIAKVTGWEKIGKYCPKCHKEIWQKHMENENGTYYLLGHPDFKTGDCNWTSTEFSELLSKSDLDRLAENEADKAKFTEEEREDNKKKLSKIFSGLFK